MRKIPLFLLAMFAINVFAEVAVNEQVTTERDASEISKEAVSIKQSVLELNRSLYQLEEDLLTPATTRAALYFSLASGEYFDPYSIKVTFDDKPAIEYLYTERQLTALRQGAVQPLAKLNIGPGIHTIKALAKGVDKNGIERQLALEKTVEKHDAPLYVELKVQDHEKTKTAKLVISQW